MQVGGNLQGGEDFKFENLKFEMRAKGAGKEAGGTKGAAMSQQRRSGDRRSQGGNELRVEVIVSGRGPDLRASG
jgi:hypothetical protein